MWCWSLSFNSGNKISFEITGREKIWNLIFKEFTREKVHFEEHED